MAMNEQYWIDNGFSYPPVALTVKEPWLTCGAFHGKPVENRTWKLPSKHVGKRVFLHTSSKLDNDGMTIASSLATKQLKQDVLFPGQCLVATAVFTDCVTSHESKWFFGPYGFIWENFKLLPNFYNCRGALNFWRVPETILLKIATDLSSNL